MGPLDDYFRPRIEEIRALMLAELHEKGLTSARYDPRPRGFGPRGGLPCACGLFRERCPSGRDMWCDDGRSITSDHLDFWLRGKSIHAVVGYPYHFSGSNAKNLLAACEKFGLRFTVEANWGMHFPGYTLALIVSKG